MFEALGALADGRHQLLDRARTPRPVGEQILSTPPPEVCQLEPMVVAIPAENVEAYCHRTAPV